MALQRWVIGIGLLLAGCSRSPGPPVPSTLSQIGPWLLIIDDSKLDTPAVLSNGGISLQVWRDASGYGPDGKQLPTFLARDRDQSGAERLELQSNPLALRWLSKAGSISNPLNEGYSQILDMRDGSLATDWSALARADGQSARLRILSKIEVAESEVAVRQRWKISADRPIALRLAEERSVAALGLFVTISPPEATAPSGLLVAPDRPIVVERTVSYGKQPIRFGTAVNDVDIEIDGSPEDQQVIRSFLFYLRSSVRALSKLPPGPFGLTNVKYGGHVFWDADAWLFPALTFIEPDAAKRIASYRLLNFTAALRNARQTGFKGALYPWESATSGRELAPEATRRQLHVNGWVTEMLDQAAALSLCSEPRAKQVESATAAFWMGRSVERSGLREILNVMGPDEFFVGDNDLVTNLLAERATRSVWPSIRFKRPRDASTLICHDGDPVRSYNQASALLAVYPLQDPEAERTAISLADRFTEKITPNGPAMSDSISATVYARFGDTAKAYALWRRSWKRFADNPLRLFSELEKKEVTYFLTGAAGSLQTVIYGFLGFRIDHRKLPHVAWQKELNGGHWLSIRPRLPAEWKRVRFRNFQVLGKRYTLTVDQVAATVTSEP